jgi:asparagine synthase (glutamine-hydrolysing)
MCGIFALLNNSNFSNSDIKTEFEKGKHRGPEFSKLTSNLIQKVDIGFHRLSINGLNEASNQPLVINDIALICNGEIYNYKELYKTMNVTPTTGSDCEVIIHLFLKYGIEQTLVMLDGVFAFILFDNRPIIDLTTTNKIYVARDPYGVRPLYQLTSAYYKFQNGRIYYNPSPTNNYTAPTFFGFASELKCLSVFKNTLLDKDKNIISTIEQFTPGSYSIFEMQNTVNPGWRLVQEKITYFIPTISQITFSFIYPKIAEYLNSAVEKRCATTERPIACLLSGGLDSSLITALVNNYYHKQGLPNKLETYSIGLQGSEDLKYARIVADYLGTNHTEVIVTEKEMFDAIPDVIRDIESYDTTSVRASIGNYLLGKYISQHSEAKVIFNGDGSDELLGGYLYMNKCPDDIEFDRETRRLLKDIHMFDVLRSDKCISSHGLEPRTPFLDRAFTNFILSIPPYFRNHKNKNNCEKYLLRKSFEFEYFANYNNKSLLPPGILWRKKEAFSDGVSGKGRSLYQVLQEHIAFHLNTEKETSDFLPCIETEKYYYKKLFDEFYPNCSNILPYFWMPKYTNATDPSARTLTFYKEETIENEISQT